MGLTQNPQAGRFSLPEGYKDLGVRNSWNSEVSEFSACVAAGHNHRGWREFDNSLYQNRGTDVVTICDTCKVVWHTDMSD